MSKTTKSPKKLVMVAYNIANKVLAPYSHRFSPKKFTQPQLFTCLVLKTFLKQDYRGIVEVLCDWPCLCNAIGLKTMPHYTTLQKASERLLQSKAVMQLLQKTIVMLKAVKAVVPVAALDATGLQSGHISPHYYKACEKAFKNHKWSRFTQWPKIAIIADVITHLILAVHPTRGPGRDCTHFVDVLKSVPEGIGIDKLVADAGYDSEAVHCIAAELFNIKTIIPPTVGKRPRDLPKTLYRREMKINFDTAAYRQRWQVETVFSMMKHRLGYTLHAKTKQSQNQEMYLLALTFNLMIILCFYLLKSFSTEQEI
jgi:transposase